MGQINIKNIKQFIEGNLNLLGDRINILPNYMKEQVIWRMNICKDDCVIQGKCKYCGCSVPGKLYVNSSCNGSERFPDLMSEQDWEIYKMENNIKIE